MGLTSLSCKNAIRVPNQMFQFWPVRAVSRVPGGMVNAPEAADLMHTADTVGSVGALPPEELVAVAAGAMSEEPVAAPDVPIEAIEVWGMSVAEEQSVTGYGDKILEVGVILLI